MPDFPNINVNSRFLRFAVCAIVATALARCAEIEGDAAGAYVTGRHVGQTNLAFTTADDRIVIERPRVGADKERVICTEPPPDTAKVMQTILQATGGTMMVNAGVSAGISEAALELAGRSTALLGLRDGLYRVCEAYANGAIGADAYALVLTRYGQLMSTLFLSQDIAGSVGVGSGSAVSAPAFNVNAPGNTIQNGSGGSGATGKSNTGAGMNMMGDPGAAAQSAFPILSQAKDLLIPVAAQAAQGGQPAPTADMMTPVMMTGQTAGTPSSPATSTANLPSTSALALARVNEDYLALNLFPLDVLMVACINSEDQTRGSGSLKNSYLKAACTDLNLAMVKKFADAAGKLAVSLGRVDPTAGAGSAGAAKPSANSALPDPVQLKTMDLAALQKSLSAKFSYVPATGPAAAQIAVALVAYQTENGLTVTGYADNETINGLGLKLQNK